MKGIKLELIKSNKTQRDLAKHLEVREETVSIWVNGHRDPSIKTLEKIALYLDCDLFNLIKL
jgi:transcriptional regulator with XRE-family HTH domain